jgi:hypothetical protein
MQANSNTFSYQSSFANYCRTGNESYLSGVRKDRARHYYQLVSNIVSDTLVTAYPLTKQLLTKSEWDILHKDFMSNHTCMSPQIWKMPFELIEFVKKNTYYLIKKYPFLVELLFFEWVEIEVFMSEDKLRDYTLNGNPESSVLMINPEISLHKFTYPIHLKNASKIRESDKGEYFLSVHRHPETGKVYFTNLSPALVLLIEFLIEKPMKLAELTLEVTGKLNMEFNHKILVQVSAFVCKALENRLIIGYARSGYDDN